MENHFFNVSLTIGKLRKIEKQQAPFENEMEKKETSKIVSELKIALRQMDKFWISNDRYIMNCELSSIYVGILTLESSPFNPRLPR